MKTLTLLACILTAAVFNDLTATAFPPAPNDSVACVEIKGRIDFTDTENAFPCIIELITNGILTDTIVLAKGRKSFRCYLLANRYYAIRISKQGYIPKLISVYTDMAKAEDGLHLFKFNTDLLPEKKGKHLNADALDFPVAIVYFDKKTEQFTFNEAYSAKLKEELRRK
jgi:hypothetical protein